MKNILVLSSAESPANKEALGAFADQINANLSGHAHIDVRHYSQISMLIKTDDMVVTETLNGKDLREYDLVYFKSYYRYVEIAVAITEFLKDNNVKFICSELKSYISFSKLSQYAKLSVHGLPIPKTYYVHSSALASKWQAAVVELGPQFICKAADAKGGDANYLVKSESQLHQVLQAHPKTEFVCQQFVPNQSDTRFLVINFKVKLAIQRTRTSDDTHLNNTSQGAVATLVKLNDIPGHTKELAIKAARLFDREVAGVDIIKNSDTGEVSILEVNASPQVSTGAFPKEKIAVYSEFFKDL